MRKFPHLERTFAPLWTRDSALPFWGTVGVDDARGGFHERLDMRGAPVLDVPKRLMVQSRRRCIQNGLTGSSSVVDGRYSRHR
jgi:mannose/cellobiose epimerase-like protein (N-acyl-D-glucosamine 2-epimerase family)